MFAGGFDPKLRVYDLRHTNISAVLAAGEQLLTVSKRVGSRGQFLETKSKGSALNGLALFFAWR